MTKRLIILLLTLCLAVPVFAQSIFFICGNEGHRPSHSALTLDDAKGLTKRHGCSDWKVHSPWRGNSMPTGDAMDRYVREAAEVGKFSSQLNGLNEFSNAAVSAITWQQLRPEILHQQPFKIVVTSTLLKADSKRFRVAVSDTAAMPELHGYLTVARLRGEDLAFFASTGRFVEVPREPQAGMAIYEFDLKQSDTDYSSNEIVSFGLKLSQFMLADAPLDKDGTTPKNVYWFYLADFDKR